MFDGIKNAGSIVGTVIQVPIRYPPVLLPLLVVWVLYAPAVIFLYFYYDWADGSVSQNLSVIFSFILFLSASISFSCFILLEQIRRIETGVKPGLIIPFAIATQNFLRALPVVFSWALIWFAITILDIILNRKETPGYEDPSPENIARLMGGDGVLSLGRAFFEALKKGARMLAFLIFPAIAWERSDKPILRGIAVARSHKTEFATGFFLTEIVASIVFIPPAIIFAASEFDIAISNEVWFAVIIYSGFAWSLSLLVEQLFTAELYLWDKKWRRACEIAETAGESVPKLRDIKRPSILDDVADLGD